MTLSSLCGVLSKVVAEGMQDLKSDLKMEWSQVGLRVRQHESKSGRLTTEIDQQLKATTNQIKEVTKRMGEMERSLTGREKWGIGVRDTLIQLLNNQNLLQAKIAIPRCNDIKTYGIPENAEGSSILQFEEHLIQSELGEIMGLSQTVLESKEHIEVPATCQRLIKLNVVPFYAVHC